MLRSDFDFELPEELIAQRPPDRRDASRMLVVRRDSGELLHHTIADFPEFLAPGDLLVLNDSRVFPARTEARLETGGRLEALFVRRLERGEWLVLLRPSKKAKQGVRLHFPALQMDGEVLCAGGEGEWVVRFDGDTSVAAALREHGEVPLPPYIKRTPDEMDRRRYQTVYAGEEGSVAAPTAGLHFTPKLLEKITARGIATEKVTLHVGPGTFRPIRTESVEDHQVEPELYEIGEDTATAIDVTRSAGGRVIAVGTTTVRTLEGAANGGRVAPGTGATDLYIHPPYNARLVDAMLTNFHLPGSSLFVLVCALWGTDLMRRAYHEAIEEGYRFYSYGDCMLII